MNAIIASATVFLLISHVNCQILESPCPNVLTYEEQLTNDRWQGILNLKSREALEGIWLNIYLNSKADVLITNFGPTSSANNQNFAINNPDYSLKPGAILKVKFTIKYNTEKPIPNVVSVKLNGVEICRNVRGASDIASNDVPAINAVVTESTTERPRSPTPARTLITRFETDDITCGRKPQARPLLYNAYKSEGHWPWHIAIMIVKGSDFDYHCGGSLISDKYALTAAHCLTKWPTNKLLDTDMFLLYLGLTHLSNLGPSFKLRLVENIQIHNEYDPRRYHNDVAVVELSAPVEFNDFIRPICLWSGNLSIRDLVGKYGTVVGWGIDNNNETALDLMEARMPIVALETCLYFDTNFYSQFTSPKTYCAGGGRNGSAVCSGDSGGGMVFPRPDPTGQHEVWYIRGIVSISPKDRESVCNTKSYAVFTDVAQHLDWIKQAAKLE